MQERLSVKKVYRNAYRYVTSHWFAFVFLTVFYFLGSLLPMLAKRIGLDPTVMASPLISTILDAVSLIIFFNIAVAVLGI